MAIWIQPALRARQEAMEAEGLIPNTDSTLMTIQKNKEAQGLAVKPSLPGTFQILRGNKHIANNEI